MSNRSILAIERNVLQTNYCVDFQSLIRVCFLHGHKRVRT
jgi:hypothetical protein